MRWPSAEKRLEGHGVTPERIVQAAATVEAEARPEGDHLGSAEYRRAVGAVLARRALTAAWQRATRERPGERP
jgi:carbon-monoxide dehydrogenase medium subunit